MTPRYIVGISKAHDFENNVVVGMSADDPYTGGTEKICKEDGEGVITGEEALTEWCESVAG